MIKTIFKLTYSSLIFFSIVLLSACSTANEKKQKLPTTKKQLSGSQNVTVDINGDYIIYQDNKLTIKGLRFYNARGKLCKSGHKTSKKPLKIIASYTVDHFERDSLFTPSYELFIQQNILPPIKRYCLKEPSIIELTMNKWDILTFKVAKGKVIGNGYIPPISWKTKSVDQKKLEAYVEQMAIAQNDTKQFQTWLQERAPDALVKNGEFMHIRSIKNMTSHTDIISSNTIKCNKSMNLYIQTDQASFYEGNNNNLQKLIDAERVIKQEDCPNFEEFIINGALEGKWYFRGSTKKIDNWAIKGQIINNDDKYLEPYMFPKKTEDIYKLGLMYLSGDRLAINHYKAVGNIKRAAVFAHPDAQYTFGILHDNGKLIKKNKHDALFWMKEAANQGHKKAQEYIQQQENIEELKIEAEIEAEKAARKKGIVYKSDRFWQEFSTIDILQNVFDGEFNGFSSSMKFKDSYVDFVAAYSNYCKEYLPQLRDRRTYITTEVTKKYGVETSRREKNRTDIYIDPRFTDSYDRYLKDIKWYTVSKTFNVVKQMMNNLKKQSLSNSIKDAAYNLNLFEMRKLFNKISCNSATMYQMKENMLRVATSIQPLQASGIKIKNAEQESDSVEANIRKKTFKQACNTYPSYGHMNANERNEWCSCLNQEALRIMTESELNRFADDFASYTDIDYIYKEPNDPLWRFHSPFNKCRN